MIIALTSKKGGVGKSTTAVYLAAVIASLQKPVTLVDSDPEQSAYKMYQAGLLPFEVTVASSRTLKQVVNGLSGDVIIDTAPNDGEIIFKAAALADEVIVPIASTGYDLARLTDTLSILADVEEMRNVGITRILLTRMQARKNIAKEVIQALDEREIPRFQTHIRYLTAYENYSGPTFLDEYTALYNELVAA